jgi:hypothetical protein
VKSGKPEQASFIVTAELTNKDEPPLATPQAHVILKYVGFTHASAHRLITHYWWVDPIRDLLGMVEPLYMPETQTYIEAKILIVRPHL